jgi:putative membrane protein
MLLPPASRRLAILLLLAFSILLVRSSIRPHDPFVWFLEILPAAVGVCAMVFFSPHFRFTNLVTILVFLHCVILLTGAHYTYAEVPIFNRLRDIFHLKRNNYDKVGHFAQGFIPVLIIREVLLRLRIISRNINKYWLPYISMSITLSYSAIYELIEWAVAEVTGTAADAFLGTQGYVWDTQSDMLYCWIGSIVSLLLLSNLHDKYISRIEQSEKLKVNSN